MTSVSEQAPAAGSVGEQTGDGRLAAAAGLAALGAACLAGMAAAVGPEVDGRIDLALFALSGAFLLAALVAMIHRRRRLAAYASGRAAFDALFSSAAGPAVLTDAKGRVLAAAGDEDAGPAALSRWTADDGVVYRVARQALAEGEARETAAPPGGPARTFRALRLGEDRLLWSISPEGAAPAAAHEEAGYAHVRLGPTGAVISSNAAFRKLGHSDQDAIVGAAVSAMEGGEAFGEAALASGSAEIAISPYPDAADAFVLPPSGPGGPNESFFEELPVALASLSEAGEILSVNEAARALLGEAAAPGVDFRKLVEGLGRPIDQRIEDALAGRSGGRADLTRGLRTDREVYLRIAFSRTESDDGPILLAVVNDATELRTLEEQFVQSQKMQAVGQLAGGVAHDFNNLLTAILGHCDLMAMRRDDADPDFEDLTQIRQNANRAAALVRQLLAFSRQQKLNPKACALQETLGELTNLLNRLIGDRVSLDVGFETGLWPVWIDERQFEQVILNLVVNARDAMPEGGAIAISCRNERLDEPLRRDRAVVPEGDYVCIEVADEGVGMSEDTKAKVFEPFFTTKGPGEGTGLGLSTAYGIVKQTGGFIFIDSAEGEGAVFRILFPRLADGVAVATAPEEETGHRDLTGAGKILLVEDEQDLAGAGQIAMAGLLLRRRRDGDPVSETREEDAEDGAFALRAV
ncbi:MAG: ATP-binding protein, partial [Pseudomonadota bacterium]